MATILIVDDHPTNREVLVALLRHLEHRLLEASDGADALQIAKADRPDLVITDILMPTMDGFEFVRQLRADPAIAHTAVVFYTAYYREREALALARECGVSTVLAKPAEPEAILRAVHSALGTLVEPPPPSELFDRDHLRLLTDKLSQSVDELRRSNGRLTALVDLGLQLGSELDLRRLLQTVAHAAREIIGARYAIVGVVDGDRQRLRYLFTSGMDAETAARLGSPDPQAPPLRTVLDGGRSWRLHNPDGDPAAIGLPSRYPPVHAWLGAPVMSPTRTYGWLGLIDKIGAETFSDEDERLASIIAAQVGRIYQNGTLYAEVLHHASELEREISERKRVEQALDERARLASLVADVGVALAHGQTQQAALELCTQALVQHLQAAFARIWTLNEAEQILELQASSGMYTHLDGPHSRVPIGKFKIGRIALERRPHLTNSVIGDPRVSDQEWARRERMVAFAGYPLLVDGRLVGVMALFSRKLLSEATLEAMAAIADHVAIGITRKQAEAALRQAQQRLEHVVTSSPAMLYTSVVEGEQLRPTWVSENVRELMGYSADEVTTPDWWLQRVHSEDLPRVSAEIQHDLFAHDRLSQEHRFRHKDGKFRWVRSEMRLWRDAAGKPLEVIGSWSDITERKQLEDQYRQAQKMEAVGRLAGGVAHDFNNILMVINGYCEMLLGELRAGDPMRAHLEQIKKAGDRATLLTRQLLAFSRKQVLQLTILDLNTLLAEMEKMLHRLIGEDIDLVIRPSDIPWRVKADAGQLEQIVMNLAINARDAMPTGGKLTIEIANVALDDSYADLHSETSPGDYVLLAVSDTGTGMDAATKARIFEPFFTTKGDEGTGLGLATVHGIVKQSGGQIEVYSELGIGTTFKVYLPRDREGVPAPKSDPNLKRARPGSETVLLAEDEEAVRTLIRFVLEQNGYQVLEARHGGEALLICEQHTAPIDLLVTDVVMPNISGRQVAERLRLLRPQLKVLYLSGYADDAIVRHGVLDAGMAFLQKPFAASALVRKVREVLESN